MAKIAGFVAAAVGILISTLPLPAHHAFGAEFDTKKPIKLRGTVAKVEMVNPHCWIYIDVKNDDGNVQHWTLELPSTFTMARRGWTKDSLKLRDQAVVETHPAKNGTAVGISWMPGAVMKVVANGKALPTQ